MTTKELKTKIHEDVDNLNDEKVLEIVNTILNVYNSSSLKISEKHKNFLKESEISKTYSNEEAKKLVDQWLKD
jgi:hypothetical protein